MDNGPSSCRYHTGKVVKGGSKRLSCCRADSFRSPGCKLGHHQSHYFNLLHKPRESAGAGVDAAAAAAAKAVAGGGTVRARAGADVFPPLPTSVPTAAAAAAGGGAGAGGGGASTNDSVKLPSIGVHSKNTT